MKVLVTGATGFIGQYVIEQLLEGNYEVIATSTTHKKAKLFAWYDQVEFIEYDIKDKGHKNLYELFKKPDVAIHLAWPGLPNYKELFHLEENLPDQYRFVKNLIENGLKSITITGTCFEYGMRDGLLKEYMITDPQNPYALAKDTLRKFLEQLENKVEFSLRWIRLFYMYGKGQSSKSLIPLLDAAVENGEPYFNMSGGEQLRDYLKVEQVAEYIVKVALQNETTGIINCCSGKPISVRRLVEDYISEKRYNIKLNLGHFPYPDYEPMAFWGDNSKLKAILNQYK